MAQPLDRLCRLPEIGSVDRAKGEFWVDNPFMMPTMGKNLSAYERNKLFLNLHGKSFLDASYASRADIDADSRSVMAADFTGDGIPDVLVGNAGGGPIRLFRNDFPQKNRVRIDLIGVKSNRTAIGTRVIAKCGNRQIVRDQFAVNGFMGQSPLEMNIGIGAAKKIDQLIVRWPSGKTQTFRDIAAGRRILIREGEKGVVDRVGEQ